MSRTSLALVLAAGALAAAPSAAHAATTCNYVPLTHRLAITHDGGPGPLVLGRSGDAITFAAGGTPVTCAGGSPTVTNTDKIAITDSSPADSQLAVSLVDGPLAPGYSNEGQFGTPEIEVEIDAGGGDEDKLQVVGAGGADSFQAGTSDGGQTRLNLNAGEYLDDTDVVVAGIDSLVLHGGAGDDVLDARGGPAAGDPLEIEHSLFGYADDDTLYAGGTGGLLAGADGDDMLTGGPQKDRLGPMEGNDTVDGGDGFDHLVFTPMDFAGIRVDLGDPDPQDTGEGVDTLDGLEGVFGTDGPDFIRGGTVNEDLYGLGGDDVIDGAEGNDVIVGGEGTDTIDFSQASNSVTVALAGEWPHATGFSSGKDGLYEFENVTGSPFADTISAGDGPNVLDGGIGGDQLKGLGGDDTLRSGEGVELEPDGADVLDGGTGRDTLSYAGRAGPVAVRLDGLKNEGADPNGDGVSSSAEEGDQALGIENATGGSGADRFLAFGIAANVFLGGGGADRLNGGPGADVLDGGGGIDTVSYSDRSARVAVRLDGLKNDGADQDGDGFSDASEENDHVLGTENVVGGSGGDRIVATGAVVNVLTGGAGPDFLSAKDGAAAADTLDCGTGADTHRSDPSDTRTGCENQAN